MNGYQIAHFGLAKQYKNIGPELLQASHDVLKTGVLVNGFYTAKFENWLKEKTNTKYAIACHSGTQALEIIARYKKDMHVKNMQGQPRIRLPNLTYPATINAFVTAGWDIVLSDTNEYGILEYPNSSDVWEYNCLVGLYGMKPWTEEAMGKNFGIIIDGAQHWLVANGEVGSGMAISFDPTKNLNASGNGGAIVTNDIFLHEYASKYIKNGKNDFSIVGTNSQLSEQDAAQLLVRTTYIDSWQKRREKIAVFYNENFNEIPVRILCDSTKPHAYQKYVLYAENRTELQSFLEENSIETRISYKQPINELLAFSSLSCHGTLTNSRILSKGVLGLPIYPELTDVEVEYVVNCVKKFYK